MWELDYKESRELKNWCFWIVVLEKTLESPLDYKEIQTVHPEGDQSRLLIRRTDDETETPIVFPHDSKNWLIGKDPDAGKDWKQKKRVAEDEMVKQQHRLNGHESEQILWDGEPQSAAGHAVAKSQMWLSDWITTVPALEHFYVSWYISKSGTAGSYGSLIFSFMRKFHAVFDSGCTNLHSH